MHCPTTSRWSRWGGPATATRTSRRRSRRARRRTRPAVRDARATSPIAPRRAHRRRSTCRWSRPAARRRRPPSAPLDRGRAATRRRRQLRSPASWPPHAPGLVALYDPDRPGELAAAIAAASTDPASTWHDGRVPPGARRRAVGRGHRRALPRTGRTDHDVRAPSPPLGLITDGRHASVPAQPLGPRPPTSIGAGRRPPFAVIVPYFEQPESLRRMYAALDAAATSTRERCELRRHRRRLGAPPPPPPASTSRTPARSCASPTWAAGPARPATSASRRRRPTSWCSSTPTPSRRRAPSSGWPLAGDRSRRPRRRPPGPCRPRRLDAGGDGSVAPRGR